MASGAIGRKPVEVRILSAALPRRTARRSSGGPRASLAVAPSSIMRGAAEVAAVLELRGQGLGARRIAARTGLPVSTVRDWPAGRLPRHARPPAPSDCPVCGHPQHAFDELPAEYYYLLGVYLGDGCISAGRRDVYRLRINLDLAYPGIVDECERPFGPWRLAVAYIACSGRATTRRRPSPRSSRCRRIREPGRACSRNTAPAGSTNARSSSSRGSRRSYGVT